MIQTNYLTLITKFLLAIAVTAFSMSNFAFYPVHLDPVYTSADDDFTTVSFRDEASIACYNSAVNYNTLESYCALLGWTLPILKDCKASAIGNITFAIHCPKTPTICQTNPQLCASTPDP